MSERRTNPRTNLEVSVEVTWPDGEVDLVRTLDLSSSGLFLLLAEDKRPPIGTKLWVRISGALPDGEKPPMTRVEVRRITDQGVGTCFI